MNQDRKSNWRPPTAQYSVLVGALALLLTTAQGSAAQDRGAPTGTGSYTFTDSPGARERPVTVYYHRPENLAADARILFVMHGNGRNASSYLRAWVRHADEHRFLLIAPEFSREHYPNNNQYNLGNMFGRGSQQNDESEWSFTTIAHIFDDVRERFEMRTPQYSIYGHSAGGQFVHRMFLFHPDPRIEVYVAANPGWWTTLDMTREFPYGLNHGDPALNRRNRARVPQALQEQLVVLLGDRDTNPTASDLRRTPGAMAQGRHRFERGQNFFANAQAVAESLGVEFAWKMQVVEGAGHSNARMAPGAIQALDW